MKSYTFKIVPKRSRGFYVIIEAFESNTFDQLHRAILGTLRWDEDHLYSFFMSGKAWDRETEYSTDDCVEDMPMLRDRNSKKAKINSLAAKAGDRFLYPYDYGDCHEFDIEVLDIRTVSRKGSHPMILELRGSVPVQYPSIGEYGVRESTCSDRPRAGHQTVHNHVRRGRETHRNETLSR